MLEKLDYDNIPNFKYIDKKYVGLGYDPKSEYTVFSIVRIPKSSFFIS